MFRVVARLEPHHHGFALAPVPESGGVERGTQEARGDERRSLSFVKRGKPRSFHRGAAPMDLAEKECASGTQRRSPLRKNFRTETYSDVTRVHALRCAPV